MLVGNGMKTPYGDVITVPILSALIKGSNLILQTLWSQGAYQLEIISAHSKINALRPKGLGDETIKVMSINTMLGEMSLYLTFHYLHSLQTLMERCFQCCQE